jgi:virginiamycin A acetyltransferase
MAPNPDTLHPIKGHDGTVFLQPLLARYLEDGGVPNIDVGAFSYYSSFDDPTRFFLDNVLYNFGFSGARLRIGKYCAIAHGARFIMPDANHSLAGPSTFPFAIFGEDWAEALPLDQYPFPAGRDTVIGNDVWIGYGALIMPGVTIGDGAIVSSGSVVRNDVPPYSIVAGNPATVVRPRFDPGSVATLQALCWWDWPGDLVCKAIPLLVKGDVVGLEAFARSHIPDYA